VGGRDSLDRQLGPVVNAFSGLGPLGALECGNAPMREERRCGLGVGPIFSVMNSNILCFLFRKLFKFELIHLIKFEPMR
jgi:hypothetical protein